MSDRFAHEFKCGGCGKELSEEINERDGEWIGALAEVIQPSQLAVEKKENLSLAEIVKMFLDGFRKDNGMVIQ